MSVPPSGRHSQGGGQGLAPPSYAPALTLKKNIFQGKSNTKHAYSIVLPLVQVSTFVSNCSLISTFVSNCSLISTFVSNLGFPNEAEHPYYKRGGFQLLSGPHQVGHTVGEETLRGGADEQCSSDYTTLNIYRGTVQYRLHNSEHIQRNSVVQTTQL